VRIARLPIGTRFNDFYGKQVFEKVGECTAVRGRKRLHILKCLHSPFKTQPGPICAAFFCAIGDVVYRGGSLRVFPIQEDANAK
jgi:hypothetical protein